MVQGDRTFRGAVCQTALVGAYQQKTALYVALCRIHECCKSVRVSEKACPALLLECEICCVGVRFHCLFIWTYVKDTNAVCAISLVHIR